MKFKLVKLNYFTGEEASIYAVVLDDRGLTLFSEFVNQYIGPYPAEIDFIKKRLMNIGHRYGAREEFFKENEGRPGDGVCALYDKPGSKLRLYCIKNGRVAIILGGGGPKPKTIRKLQESKKLDEENKLIRLISKLISNALIEGDVKWSQDGKNLIGNLTFTDDERYE